MRTRFRLAVLLVGLCVSMGCMASRQAHKQTYIAGSEEHPIATFAVQIEDGVLTDRAEFKPAEGLLWAIAEGKRVVVAFIGLFPARAGS